MVSFKSIAVLLPSLSIFGFMYPFCFHLVLKGQAEFFIDLCHLNQAFARLLPSFKNQLDLLIPGDNKKVSWNQKLKRLHKHAVMRLKYTVQRLTVICLTLIDLFLLARHFHNKEFLRILCNAQYKQKDSKRHLGSEALIRE